MNIINTTKNGSSVRLALGAFLVAVMFSMAPVQTHALSIGDVLDPFGIFDGGSGGNHSSTPARPPLVISCNANVTEATTRDRVTWSASVSGGTNKYTYKWTGSEGLSGTDRSISKNYTMQGYKDASITVKSGTVTKTVQCGTSPYITEIHTDDGNGDDDDNGNGGSLRVSCYADEDTIEVGERVTWYSRVSGGTGSYEYDWDGDDGLNGSDDQVTKRYNDYGTKEASLTVRTSHGDRKTVDCDDEVRVEDDYYNDDDYNDDYRGGSLNGNCYATPTYAAIGEQVAWRASVWGGNGNYTYDWSGDENLDGRGSSVYKRYQRKGTMSASVRVRSGSRSITLYCGDTINVTGNGTIYPPSTGGQSLSFSCSPNVSTAKIGNNVTWSSNVIGGNGNYIYSWTGTDGITSSGSTMSGFYDGIGTKYAYLTVRSGTQTATKACGSVYISNATVYQPPTTVYVGGGSAAKLDAVCYPSVEAAAPGESVLWTVEANGGTGTYTYSWTGADNLRGTQPVVVKSYKNDGAKYAVVTVKSGSQSVTQACDTITNVGASSVFGANALFGIHGISWGFIGFLILLLLILVIGYVLYNKSKI